MALFSAILMLAASTFLVLQLWERLTEAEGAARWFWRWHAKGIAVPVAIWLLLGLGVVPGLPGLIPHERRPGLLDLSGLGVILIASWWAGLTIAWFAAMVTRQIPRENHAPLRRMWLVRSLLTFPLAAWLVHGTGWDGVGAGLALWLLPVAHGLVNLRTVERKKPVYATAIARMKFDRYEEAEKEIIRQLEECEDDF